MTVKPLLVFLLGLWLTGCAVYGQGQRHGQRDHDRHYSTTYYPVQRYPVYVVPQPQRYKHYRHDGRRYDDHHQPPRYYAPAAQQHHDQSRTNQNRHEYRVMQPHAGWDARSDRDASRHHDQPRQQRHDAQHGSERRFERLSERRDDDRRDDRKGWERQRN